MISLEQTRKFYAKKKLIEPTILGVTDSHEIIHGSRALNKRFPPFLRKQTTDYDIFSKTPRKDARQAERALDRRFGFNAFEVKAGKHKGTWKVMSRVNGEGYADYTKPERKVCSERIGKYNYACLSYMEAQAKRTLKDKESAYRHAKDRDAINRIKVYRKTKKHK